MSARFSDGEDYLRMYPDLRRWMNICVACGHQGYKPEMPPNDAPKFRAQNLRRYFRPLVIDSVGLCEQCSQTPPLENHSNA
jgi:hypothetical protein